MAQLPSLALMVKDTVSLSRRKRNFFLIPPLSVQTIRSQQKEVLWWFEVANKRIPSLHGFNISSSKKK